MFSTVIAAGYTHHYLVMLTTCLAGRPLCMQHADVKLAHKPYRTVCFVVSMPARHTKRQGTHRGTN